MAFTGRTLDGVGQLLGEDGATILQDVAYTINVFPPKHEGGIQTILGHLHGVSFDDPFTLVGERVTLVLEDDRSWDCLVENTAGSLVGAGGKGLIDAP